MSRLALRAAVPLFFFVAICFGQAAPVAGPGRQATESSGAARALSPSAALVPEKTLSPEAVPEPVRLVSSDETRVEFEFAVDGYELSGGPDAGFVSAPGLDRLAEPGEPDICGYEVMVGIPQSGGVRVSARGFGEQTFDRVRLRPMAGFDEGPAARSDVYGQDRFWPAELARVEDIETLRGVRVARVRVFPVRFNPQLRQVRAFRRVTVVLSFDRPAEPRPGLDRFGPVLAGQLLNGGQAQDWKLDPDGSSDSVNFFTRYANWCKVTTDSAAVYRLTPQDLEAAGFTASGIDPRTLRLFSIGPHEPNGPYADTMVEVPVHVTGEDDGSFSGNDYLAFYAQAPSCWRPDTADTIVSWEWRQNLYTERRAWWLTWGNGDGKRMATVSGAGGSDWANRASHRVRLEKDQLCPARSGLLWLWNRYFKQAGLPASTSELVVEVPNRDTLHRLSFRFYGRSAVNNLRLYLNGVELDSFGFPGAQQTPPPVDRTIENIPASAHGSGTTDTLTLELLGDNEIEIYLDWIEAEYTERLAVTGTDPLVRLTPSGTGSRSFAVSGASGDALVLDISDPWNPRRVTDTEVSGSERRFRYEVAGRTVLACGLTGNLREPVGVGARMPNALRSPQVQADYYIVCPDEFVGAARLLARYRQGNVAGVPDAATGVADLADIYDEYAFGMEEPGAIKKFLQAKQPAYGLFAGDATYDYRNRLGLEVEPGVPTHSVGYDIYPEVYGSQAKAFDAWFADFDGDGSGPDMILGRVTCRSSAELRRFLDKVRTYESQPAAFWTKRLLLLADDEWLGQPGKPDQIGFAHIGGCENVRLYTQGLLDPVKVYLTEYPFTGVNDKAGARVELLEQLRQGALLWFFFGHGAGFQLCHERALNIDGVGNVDTGTRNPVAFFGSCGVGRFEDTRYQAIAEELVRMQSGCIATAGATKATTPGGNELVARTWMSNMITHPELTVGSAWYGAWLKNTIYHLFGDPAMKLRLPTQGVEPVVTPDALHPGGSNAVADSVPVESGMYAITAHEAEWFRTYISEAGSTSYYLPGYRVHTGIGTFTGNTVRTSFVVPRLDYADTLVVPDGRYVRLPNSCRVSLLAWSDGQAYTSIRGELALGDTVSATDRQAPDLLLLADGRPLSETDTVLVPGEFDLVGVCTDESGILLAPVADYGLSFYQGAGVADRIRLHGRFSYDQNSTTRGRFSYPVTVGQGVELDSFTVTVSDNLRNRKVARFRFRTRSNEALNIDSCLVYPNPTPGWPTTTRFTFDLTRPAFVTVKIYSLSGRLVRRLPEQLCGFGYNQVDWDGRDELGRDPGNGVYLYKLDARTSEAGTGSQTYNASVRDRLVIQR